MAIACFLLLTVFLDFPLLSVPSSRDAGHADFAFRFRSVLRHEFFPLLGF